MNPKVKKALFNICYIMLCMIIAWIYYNLFDFITMQMNISYEGMDIVAVIFVIVYLVIVLPFSLIFIRYLKLKIEDN